ncbi:MAG: hypothetical protein J1E43_00055 [Christensenellaceae bacterium]|nr:hypothetical protein [Christensenellaceae bacterium]
MASYTIEDIELIRRKSGISYQEAVALLDYHNGNVARALVDLERNGRIKPETSRKVESEAVDNSKKGFMNLMTRLYQFRLKVKKGSVTILNLSLLFSLLALIISPHLVIIGAILMLILGYHVSFDKHDADFASDNLERMVRNAGDNVKGTVSDFTRGFEEAFNGSSPKPQQEPAAEQTAEPASAAPERSYYTSNPAATTQHHAYRPDNPVPTIQVPVQVESQDGSVQLDSDQDGYHSATIE